MIPHATSPPTASRLNMQSDSVIKKFRHHIKSKFTHDIITKDDSTKIKIDTLQNNFSQFSKVLKSLKKNISDNQDENKQLSPQAQENIIQCLENKFSKRSLEFLSILLSYEHHPMNLRKIGIGSPHLFHSRPRHRSLCNSHKAIVDNVFGAQNTNLFHTHSREALDALNALTNPTRETAQNLVMDALTNKVNDYSYDDAQENFPHFIEILEKKYTRELRGLSLKELELFYNNTAKQETNQIKSRIYNTIIKKEYNCLKRHEEEHLQKAKEYQYRNRFNPDFPRNS